LPSLAAVYITRKYIVPVIPLEIGAIGALTITRDMLLMVLFALLMIFSAFSMIRRNNKGLPVEACENTSPGKVYWVMAAEGVGVGVLTALVGAEEAFLFCQR
jgi:uncharacterized membrane protein YfcA